LGLVVLTHLPRELVLLDHGDLLRVALLPDARQGLVSVHWRLLLNLLSDVLILGEGRRAQGDDLVLGGFLLFLDGGPGKVERQGLLTPDIHFLPWLLLEVLDLKDHTRLGVLHLLLLALLTLQLVRLPDFFDLFCGFFGLIEGSRLRIVGLRRQEKLVTVLMEAVPSCPHILHIAEAHHVLIRKPLLVVAGVLVEVLHDLGLILGLAP